MGTKRQLVGIKMNSQQSASLQILLLKLLQAFLLQNLAISTDPCDYGVYQTTFYGSPGGLSLPT